MARVKITVLKRLDPKTVFGEDVPVNPTTGELFGVCNVYTDGQEFIVEEDGGPFFEGYRVVELFGRRDESGIGYLHGPVTVYTDAEIDEVAWIGRSHAYTEYPTVTSGKIILHGVGAYEGMQLKLDVEQTGPGYYELEGRLLRPHGE